MISLIVGLGIVLAFISLSVTIVPQENAYIVERLGKYHTTLNAGLHFIVPFLDKIRSRVDLRERAIDIASQVCITKDNIQVAVDGVIYIQVTDAKESVYGTSNYIHAVSTLSQTTLRSVIGKMDLEETFENRVVINSEVVNVLNEAAVAWGVKLLRYEIKDLTPPNSILAAMEKQTTAERERRSNVIQSEGYRATKINESEGEKLAAINKAQGEAETIRLLAEGEKLAEIQKAQAEAEAIQLIAEATKNSIKLISDALDSPNGHTAANLKISEQYINAFSNLAKTNNTMIIPAELSNVSGTVATIMKTIENQKTLNDKQLQ